MNIIVCIKQVPGTTEIKINPETNTLIREGVKSIINPFDTYAVEEALRLKERYGGKVTVITMGPLQAEEALRETIAMGADEAILISDRVFAGSDTLATAYVLAAAITRIARYDLIICGKQTLDGDTGQVGPELAERLGISFVAYVSRIEEVSNTSMRLQRLIEDGYQIVETALPAVISVTKEINTPRLPSLRGMVRAKSIPIPVWTAQDLNIPPEKVGIAGSPTQVIKIFSPRRVRQGQLLKGKPEEQVELLVKKLQELKLV